MTMDLWTDPNLSPFMAVTAHWIEASTVQTVDGPQHVLKLRADLIGFHRVPGHHDGEHLAHAFLYIIDCLEIAEKVCLIFLWTSKKSDSVFQIGWITLDNASNNDTFMYHLELLLRKRHILFCKVKRRIR